MPNIERIKPGIPPKKNSQLNCKFTYDVERNFELDECLRFPNERTGMFIDFQIYFQRAEPNLKGGCFIK